MNGMELAGHVAQKLGITKAQSKAILAYTFDKIISEVRRGRDVKISGFGVFYKAERKARKGRNPQNGEPVDIPEVEVPRFRPGKKFKEAVK